MDTSPRESATEERIGHLAPGKPRNGVSVLFVKTKLLLTPESSNELCARVCALRQLIAMAEDPPDPVNDGSKRERHVAKNLKVLYTFRRPFLHQHSCKVLEA